MVVAKSDLYRRIVKRVVQLLSSSGENCEEACNHLVKIRTFLIKYFILFIILIWSVLFYFLGLLVLKSSFHLYRKSVSINCVPHTNKIIRRCLYNDQVGKPQELVVLKGHLCFYRRDIWSS